MKHRDDLEVIRNIRRYKRKYYTNLLLRGFIWTLACLLAIFLVLAFAEYLANFNSTTRTLLFFGFTGLALVVLYLWVLRPLGYLFSITRPLTDEEAARRIGAHFPEVKDKLINVLQLRQLAVSSPLAAAGMQQKASEISTVHFDAAVDYSSNRQYLRYLLPPLAVLILAAVFLPELLTDSTRRLVSYRQEFRPAAPFQFMLLTENLQAFRNEDFTLQLQFSGTTIPQTAYLVVDNRRLKMQREGELFTYTFPKVQEQKNFYFEAAGFESDSYTLVLADRPDLKGFRVKLQYPDYLGREPAVLDNTGSFQVPEGTNVQWQFFTAATDSLRLRFSKDSIPLKGTPGREQQLQFSKVVSSSQHYTVELKNRWSQNRDAIQYELEVIPDRHPQISLNKFSDTLLYNYLILAGNVSDDYGLTRLQVHYRLTGKNGQEGAFKRTVLPLQRGNTSQTYYYRWQLDSLGIGVGDKLEYFVQVWDNDGVNGAKASRTGVYMLQLPEAREVEDQLSKAEQQNQSQIDENLKQAKQLKDQLKKAEERLRGKNRLDYQDEKILEEIVQERQKLEEALQKLQEQQKLIDEQKKRFNQQDNEKIAEKAEQLRQLMNELLDEETKKLYEELQKLLEEKSNPEELRNVLDKLNRKENNLEKELERTLELFKRMKFENQLDQTIDKLDKLQKEQEELAQKSEEKNPDTEQLQQEQEQLNEEFKELEKQMEELQKLNQDLKSPNSMEDTKPEQQEIKKQQEQSQQELQDGKPKKAGKAQQKAAEQMKKMQQKLQQMQGGMEMESMQENMDNLRDIVDNLVKLSFDQEALMKEFRGVNQSDPRFVALGQQQLKLKDDAVILEDSLRSLAERVFQIRSFVTREVDQMNRFLEESVESIRERKKGTATGKQQFAMTSMNNLALLLDDILQQMQQQMADAMGNPQKGNQKGQMPSMGQMQQQLNERIQKLREGGKSGREVSEELARMAAEQERIREALKEMEEKYGKDGKLPGSEGLQKMMEQTETELVNKRLSRELMERQQQIMTRLLEAEKAVRERELDEERKGETAKEYERQAPRALEDYLKQKEKEVELLRSVPPKLNSFYKEEITNYFKRLEQ
ncbi:DUF4175 family protein [Cesiribacter andamanensis]|uniref:ATPase involved in DNA repair n=1 Tax=Cesiribacter andamanensis AMV16 TaxID=1279009 RepID=M7NMX4_9BACT|nr:DUF4175 family protein [Cesiribacter andamanensis]EMR03105.1 hypothetical protein ADICEAN_01764 [Cesiribacter andamanensis AMV16]